MIYVRYEIIITIHNSESNKRDSKNMFLEQVMGLPGVRLYMCNCSNYLDFSYHPLWR